MSIEQINIEDFLQLSTQHPVFDVRSPGEFSHAHIPCAYSLPLFTNEQRKIIGIAYKQQSRQDAVKKGLDYFSERMKEIPVETENIYKSFKKLKHDEKFSVSGNAVFLHCWRGGMRSNSVAWLLNLYGFKVYTLKGGYKAFRNWVLAMFRQKYNINVLGGYTGSGKTLLLHEMKKMGHEVIDLEKLSNHKGSAFGLLGEEPQPSQEMFENMLAIELYNAKAPVFWVEDESRHIGSVGVPNLFWDQMRKSSLYFLEIPFEERLQYIVSTYGKFDKKDLINSILKIQKRLGGLETKNAVNSLLENNFKDCFSILLKYYDRFYNNSLYKRENIETLLNKISCSAVDINNAHHLETKMAGLI